jgi:hypothetical protein
VRQAFAPATLRLRRIEGAVNPRLVEILQSTHGPSIARPAIPNSVQPAAAQRNPIWLKARVPEMTRFMQGPRNDRNCPAPYRTDAGLPGFSATPVRPDIW